MPIVTLIENYSDVELLFTSEMAALDFIKEKADEWNCGIFRTWQLEGYQYFDCGPRTFKTTAKLLTL